MVQSKTPKISTYIRGRHAPKIAFGYTWVVRYICYWNWLSRRSQKQASANSGKSWRWELECSRSFVGCKPEEQKCSKWKDLQAWSANVGSDFPSLSLMYQQRRGECSHFSELDHFKTNVLVQLRDISWLVLAAGAQLTPTLPLDTPRCLLNLKRSAQLLKVQGALPMISIGLFRIYIKRSKLAFYFIAVLCVLCHTCNHEDS